MIDNATNLIFIDIEFNGTVILNIINSTIFYLHEILMHQGH